MVKLTDEMKEAIVVRLAQFDGYAAVARDVGEAFGIELSRFHVRAYDASSYGFAAGDRWRERFRKYRDAYLTDIGAIPIAHTAFRLNQLQEMFWLAKSSGNFTMALRLLQQAAEEAASFERHRPAHAGASEWQCATNRREVFDQIFDRAFSRLDKLGEDAQSAEAPPKTVAKAG